MVCEYFQTDLTNPKNRVILLPNPRAGPHIIVGFHQNRSIVSWGLERTGRQSWRDRLMATTALSSPMFHVIWKEQDDKVGGTG